MSGFDPKWLALREPIDHRSRNRAVRDAALNHLSGKSAIRVIDLGCGTGSNFRALHSKLPPRQEWRLIDDDRTLLAAARQTLKNSGIAMPSVRQLRFQLADLATDIERLIDGTTDLVTAAALFDLVSTDWLARFVKALAAPALPLYAVLTYSGSTNWCPSHHADAEILAAFQHHQRQDKGFGAAAGPQAASILCDLLRAEGYHLVIGDSPWTLTRSDAELVDRLLTDIGEAVGQTNRLRPEDIRAWCKTRREFTCCQIGHIDLFAFRPAR